MQVSHGYQSVVALVFASCLMLFSLGVVAAEKPEIDEPEPSSIWSTLTSGGQDQADADKFKELDQQAIKLFRNRQRPEAILLAQNTLAAAEKRFGVEHAEVAVRLNLLAYFYLSAKEYAKSLPLYLRTLAIREKVLGPDHIETGGSLSDVANNYYRMGDYVHAIPLYLRAVANAEKSLRERPRLAQRLALLAEVYYEVGDYSKAQALSERALEIRKVEFGAAHRETALSMNSLADYYRGSGDYTKAMPLLLNALRIREKAYGVKSPNITSQLNNLGLLYVEMGDYGRALPLYQRAVANMERIKHSDNSYGSLLNLAELYNKMGDNAKALPLALRSLEIRERILGKDHRRVAGCLSSLARIYRDMGDGAKALELSRRALDVMEKALGPEHYRTAGVISGLARLYQSQRDYSKALPLYQRALAITEKALGTRHPLTNGHLYSLAQLYSDMGDKSKAAQLLQRTLDMTEESLGPEHPLVADRLKSLAELHNNMGNAAEALPLYARYIAAVEKLRNQSGLGVENKQNLFAQYVGGYKDYARNLGEQRQMDKAFHLFELSKARTLLEETAAHAGRLALPEEVAAKLEGLQQKLTLMNDLVAKAESDTQKVNLSSQRDDVERELSVLRERLLRQYPKYAQLTTPKILAAADAAKLLPADAVFVSFLENRGSIQALTVTSDGQIAYHDLGRPARLFEVIAAYRELITAPAGLDDNQRAIKLLKKGLQPAGKIQPEGSKDPTTLPEMQAWLSHALLAPLQERLAGKRQWILSPDGALALIPFDTLNLAGEPVLKQHDISLAQSLSIYGLLRQRAGEYKLAQRAKTVFGMGNPDFGTSDALSAAPTAEPALEAVDAGQVADQVYRGLQTGASDVVRQGYAQLRAAQWQPLPGTAAELEGVRRTFGASQTDLYLADQATETKLQSLNKEGRLADYRYILFSTHGYLSTEVPALSAVVLGQKNLTPQADGYVTAAEWPGYTMKSDLVVLSACETGVGKNVQGEGVMGLPFALYVAGNINTMLTLWSISDTATSEFMRRFFVRLNAGEDQVKALNAVKREFVADPKLNNPAYWASFVLYGV